MREMKGGAASAYSGEMGHCSAQEQQGSRFFHSLRRTRNTAERGRKVGDGCAGLIRVVRGRGQEGGVVIWVGDTVHGPQPTA